MNNLENEIEETVKQYPDCDVDDCISEITGNNLSEMDYDECDHFNLEVYFDKVIKTDHNLIIKKYHEQN